MGQDINLNNELFTPIAGAFTGTLDGRGKKIMNLKIHVSGHGALFVELGSEGNIKNLGIKEFDVTGSGQVGSLVASNSGTITSCYAVDSDGATDLSGGVNSYVGGAWWGIRRVAVSPPAMPQEVPRGVRVATRLAAWWGG